MNKIVREHYPVANLPEDLREGLEEGATVKIVVELESIKDAPPPSLPLADIQAADQKPLSIEETKALIARIRSGNRPSISAAEAVARVRELRDEWDA